MSFETATRRKVIQLPALTRPTGGGTVQQQLPKTGLLAMLILSISGSVAGTLSAPNALGMASIVKRVRLTANSGIDLINVSGAGYLYGVVEMLDLENSLVAAVTSARAAVTATTFDISMVFPIALNLRDALGMIMLQNEQTLLTLSVDFEADSVVATGATVTATARANLVVFTVPPKREDWPPLTLIHQILEDQAAVSAAGQYIYTLPRGGIYLQLFHGLGIGVAGADGFDNYQFRVNQSEYLQSSNVGYLSLEHQMLHGRARPGGGIYVDFMGSSGLGNYGSARDWLNTALLTDVQSVINATGAGTLYTVRRQLVPMA